MLTARYEQNWCCGYKNFTHMIARVKLIHMKFSIISILATALISSTAIAESEPVKMSTSRICHTPDSTYCEQTKKLTSFKTLRECLNAGGIMPKR
jgi:hypothetical protein